MKAQTLDEIVQQIETEQIRLDTQFLSRYQLTLTVRQSSGCADSEGNPAPEKIR